MESPRSWTERDILSLITDAVQESISLEYKSAASLDRTDAKKKEVSKDVSAFANSAGGVLVYGVQEDTNKRVPIKIDSGYDPVDISKEWVEQVITDVCMKG